MRILTIKSSGLNYKVNIIINNDIYNSKSKWARKGKEIVNIYTPKQDSYLIGMLYWSKQKPFDNPKNDYEIIMNYLLGEVLNG